MLLGIDVGGTFTDAVAVAGGVIIAQAKSPTTEDLLTGILASLDKVLAEAGNVPIERVALSTTFVTNALVQGKVSRVGLLLMPGPGLDCSGLLPTLPVILDGYIDHRGREAAPVMQDQVKAACRQLSDCEAIAISGKFSVRNPQHEAKVAGWAAGLLHTHITRGAEVSGGLNFPRRTNSAYYNAAVWHTFGLFASAAEEAVRRRGIQAPIYILKADGGTLPLSLARRFPVETVLTGPAASVLGIMALTKPQGQAVSLDIGGTTTDMALWQDGIPLAAPRGVQLAGYATAVRSFRLRSIGVGGDSVVRRIGSVLSVGPDRMGAAAALGGPAPTLSDAMIVAGSLNFGDPDKAWQAMRMLAGPDQTVEEIATQTLTVAVDIITREIQAMIEEHFADPVYRVEDMLTRQPLCPDKFIIVGGAGKGLAPLLVSAWAKKTGHFCTLDTPSAAVIANAVGAAVAKPTLTLTVRADSEQGCYSIPELAIRQPLERRSITVETVKQLAADYLVRQADVSGSDAASLETVLLEEFNMVRGFQTVGKSVLVQLQVTPGVLMSVSSKEVAI
ncbi:hydantoinase [Anaerosporomusa subterranea]|uniref:Hydantoinase n=1 Tax=Anaerosporomusa subterranea TaxID=1794912 RepID=A0A154BT03_ANASB|nr:hydantoinase/oxoprolinase family protein [Anaerosporomusa subterranea]KYZ76648.1 hydantoinase [Anaerosporomusa subterranea]